MSQIDFDAFVEWAESRFDSVIVKGNEVHLNSIFTEDYKHKLWCNPKGGKFERYGGVYHCWKTDEKGTLISLVMKVDQCSYEEAKSILKISTSISLADLEKKLKEFYASKRKPKSTISLPPYTHLINSLPDGSIFKQKAKSYLDSRKIPYDNLFVAVQGKYCNRIVIPWYDRYKNLVYYNTRHLDSKKYSFPPKEIASKGDHLYFPQYPKGNKVYLTEGEFDAISLHLCGLNSVAAGGKTLTNTQIEILLPYQVALSLDNDQRGKEAVQALIPIMLSFGIKLSLIRPAQGYKDWNEMWIKHNKEDILQYIKDKEKPIDSLSLTL